MNEEAAFGNATLSPVIVAGETGLMVGAVRPPGAHLSRRNDLLLVAAVAAYVILLLILMVWRGIAVTPDLLVVSLAFVAMVLGRGKLFLRDWIPFIALFLAYELMARLCRQVWPADPRCRRHLDRSAHRTGPVADPDTPGPPPQRSRL